MNQNLKTESFQEKVNLLSYDPLSIIERALFRFYDAYTQMYIPVTMMMTLQDCVITTLNEYFKFIEFESNRLQLTEKEAVTVVYKHYNKVCLHLTKCLIGKGDAGKKFFPELEEEFLKATGISIATENEHNNSPSNPKGV
jgi:hypothetical protein